MLCDRGFRREVFEVMRGVGPVDGLSDEGDPGVALVPGARVDFVHARGAGTDQIHPFFTVSYFPHDQTSERDHRRSLVLQAEQ